MSNLIVEPMYFYYYKTVYKKEIYNLSEKKKCLVLIGFLIYGKYMWKIIEKNSWNRIQAVLYSQTPTTTKD